MPPGCESDDPPAGKRQLIFLSGTVYSQPLSPTVEKKIRRVAAYGAVTVVGWANRTWWPLRLREPVSFVLLPRLPGIGLRYPLFLVVGLVVILLAVRRRTTNILVAQSPYEGVVALFGRMLARLRALRTVVVVEVHGDWEEVPGLFRRLWFPRLSGTIMTWMARTVLQRADIVRVISEFTREKVRKICPQKPLIMFPTFTDLNVFLNAPAPCENAANSSYILYVGMLVPSKGVEILLRAFGRIRQVHPEVQLVLIGSGHAEGRFRTLAQSLGLGRSVRFVPPMAQRELAAWMRAARCLVLPSFSEGLGRVILEAMACGCPVIGTDVGGIPEMVEDTVNGYLVPPRDVETLATRILDVLGDPARAEEMGRQGRARARKLFSEEGYFQRFEEMVELADLVAGTGRNESQGSPEPDRDARLR